MDEPVCGIVVLFEVVLVLGLVFSPPLTGAFYTNSANTEGNGLQGGVLDIRLDEGGNVPGDTVQERGDEVRDTWEDQQHSINGDDDLVNTLTIDAAPATVDVGTVNLSVSYSENDSGSPEGNGATTAKSIAVEEFTYGDEDLLATTIDDVNDASGVDLDDLTNGSNVAALQNLNGISAGDSRRIRLHLLGSSTLLDLGDGIDFTMAVRAENASYRDSDRTINNTIIYG